MKGEWKESTKENPCPKCGRTHFCATGRVAVLCTRVESSKPNNAGYGWQHLVRRETSSVCRQTAKSIRRRATRQMD